jgi:DNA-binding XRE family transcriptional regulator
MVCGTRLIFLNCALHPLDALSLRSHTSRRIEALTGIATRSGIECLAVEFTSSSEYRKPLPAGMAIARTDSFDASLTPGVTASGDLPDMQFLLCGYEAHVSVLHTALELLGGNRKVAVIADAVDSACAEDRSLALDRMAREGAMLVTAEMLAFEWAKTFEPLTARRIIEELDSRPALPCQLTVPRAFAPQVLPPPARPALIGDRIRQMRRERGLKLTELGQLAACSLPHLSKIENNKGSPSLNALMRISAALGTDVDHFLDEKRGSAASSYPTQ